MRLVEGIADIGGEQFNDVEDFIDRLTDVSEAHDMTVQAFDARYVVSRSHLKRAIEIADRERERGDGIVRDRGVEITLYAAGRRQIDRALEMGVSSGKTPVVVVVDGNGDERSASEAIREILDPAETLGAYDEALIREFYGIGNAELEATEAGLEALVLERVALLVVDR